MKHDQVRRVAYGLLVGGSVLRFLITGESVFVVIAMLLIVTYMLADIATELRQLRRQSDEATEQRVAAALNSLYGLCTPAGASRETHEVWRKDARRVMASYHGERWPE